MRIGGRPEILNVFAKIKELDKHARIWSQKLGPELGTTYEKRTVKLDAIPGIGCMFKFLGLGQVDFKDPHLTHPDLYLSFISNWYRG